MAVIPVPGRFTTAERRSPRLVGEPSINRSPNLRLSGRREVRAEGRRLAITPRASLSAGHSIKMAHIFRDSHAAWNNRPARTSSSRSSPTYERRSLPGEAASTVERPNWWSPSLGRRETMIDSNVGPVGDSASPPLKMDGSEDPCPSCSRGRFIVSPRISVDMDQPPSSPTGDVPKTPDVGPSRTFRLLPDLRDSPDDSLSDAFSGTFNSSHASRQSSPSPGKALPSLTSPGDDRLETPRLRRVGHLGLKTETPSPGPRLRRVGKLSDRENHPLKRIPSEDRQPSLEDIFQSSPVLHLPPRSSSPERVLEQARAPVDKSPSGEGPSTPLLLLPLIETAEELRLSPDVEIYRKDHRPRRNRCRSYFDDDLFHAGATANTRTPDRDEVASTAMAPEEGRDPRTSQGEPGHHHRLKRQPTFCTDVDDRPSVNLE